MPKGTFRFYEELNDFLPKHRRKTDFKATFQGKRSIKDMRVLGFDLYYNPLLSTREIIEISKRENRVILTKSRKLLKFKEVSHGIFIRHGTTTEQIRRIIDYLDIKDNIKPFTRCIRCNTLLNIAPKEKILDRISPKTKAFCDEYVQCPSCDKIYWKGTHFIHMKKVVSQILDQPES